jgi:hypothetical protein
MQMCSELLSMFFPNIIECVQETILGLICGLDVIIVGIGPGQDDLANYYWVNKHFSTRNLFVTMAFGINNITPLSIDQ